MELWRSERQIDSMEAALWEDYPMRLHLEFCGDIEYYHRCPHASVVEGWRSSYTSGVAVKIPVVLEVFNEGHQNSTGVCLLCVADVLKTNKIEVPGWPT